jgi:hypothetical protein
MEKEIIVTVSKHEWLDRSVSWFVYINGVKSGGEINSPSEATETARNLAKTLGGTFDEDVRNTSEMFSGLNL